MIRKNEMMNDEKKTPGEETLHGEERSGAEGSHFPEGTEDPPEGTEDSPEGPGEGALDGEEGEERGGMEPEEEPDPEAPLKAELEILQDELGRLQDQHLRLAAEFENYRKRVSTELASGWVRAQADLAGALLDGLDDLQRVSQFTSEDATLEALIEGVDLVERKFLKALTDAGLEAVDPSGEPFDPNTMEAMMRVPTEEDGQDETVHRVFQKGYLFKDQLVRPARVSVYKDDD